MLYTKGCVRSPPPPTRATHGRCVLCQCVEGCGEVCTSVHVCVSGVHSLCTCVGFGCARCARCAGMSLALDGGFQRVFCEVCAHLQNVSDSVAELDAPREQVDGSEICARVRKKQLRTGFQPVEQKRNRRQIRELFPSGAVRGRIWPDLAKSGAPAAILINAYSGDFCHPVLSNALAQEPLVYHSGTRELFSDIFGTFSEISTFSSFLQKTLKFANSVKNAQNHFCMFAHIPENIFTNSQLAQKLFHMCKTSAHKGKTQMCKCANVRKTVVHKMRKSAAQIFFQMQKSQICTVHKNTNANFCTCHNFSVHNSANVKFRQVQIRENVFCT